MKKSLSLLFILFAICFSFSQIKKEDIKFDKKEYLKEVSDNACKCIDSVNTYNKVVDSISSEIHSCIDKQAVAYQMGIKLTDIKDLEKLAKEVNGKKEINISINSNSDSNEYKKYYYEIESYLMQNCQSIKTKIASNDVVGERSETKNHEAIKYYNLGQDEFRKDNFTKAIEYYKKAVVFDSNFAFAFDNIGICSRKLGNYDDAIEAYEKSLKIDPKGLTPLQNIAIAYISKKDYKKGVKAYENLAKVDPKNPEVYYGIGNIYAQYLLDYEKALDNLCQAYNLYVEQKSPYRSDAETLINRVNKEMKKQGKEAIFNEILKKNHISPE